MFPAHWASKPQRCLFSSGSTGEGHTGDLTRGLAWGAAFIGRAPGGASEKAALEAAGFPSGARCLVTMFAPAPWGKVLGTSPGRASTAINCACAAVFRHLHGREGAASSFLCSG